jgi:cellulose synthase/poly-beta-1,6-N-acetylglucosamine synthase-like glycosyltransferase
MFFHRATEVAIPLLSWIIITLPLWLSPFHPAVVAYFIIAFDLYFLYKSAVTTYLATVSYQRIIQASKIDFVKKLLRIKKSQDINHFIIIPNYKEQLHKLESTIDSIVKNDYPFKTLYLVLAFEEREAEAQEKARALTEKYRSHFKDIFLSYHVLLENEESGKASNQTYAAKIVNDYTNKNNLRKENVVITICDADSHLSKNYFSYLTCEFLKDKERQYHFYWAPVLLYNNFWQLPFFVRIQATLSSIIRLAFLSQKEKLIQISTYSTNLWLLNEIGFWDTDIIPEDWHIYFQAFFKFGDKVRTLPLFTIINGDAVYSGGLVKTLFNRYEQEKRWAWGVTDVGYCLKKSFTTPGIKLTSKLKKIFQVAESHLLWPTSFFVLTLSALIPPLINPVFKRTVLGFLLPKLSGLILTLASSMLVLYVYLDIKLRQKVNLKININSLPLLFIQWYLLPVISFLFSSLPALEAHTRLIFGKKIKYKVTEKV